VLWVTGVADEVGLTVFKTPEAVMYGANRQTHLNRFPISAISAMMAYSPIVVALPAYRSSFPNGYERVDIKILKWIRRVLQQPESAAAATRRRAS
jgi:hypothetical protein